MTLSDSHPTDKERDEYYRCFFCGAKCDFFVSLGVEQEAGRTYTDFQSCSGHMGLLNSKMIGTSIEKLYDETRDLLV